MAQRPTKLTVHELDEADYPIWNAFVEASPSGSVYSRTDYLDILCTSGGGCFRVLVARKGEELHGGIGLYERSTAAGTILSGRLLLYYNGFVLKAFHGKYPGQVASKRLAALEALEREIRARGYDRIIVRSRHHLSDYRVFLRRGWEIRPSYSYLVHLKNPAEAFGRIDQNQRRLIRRCEEAGVTLSHDRDFESFFRLHRMTSERKGAPLYLPEAAFRKYFEAVTSKGLGRPYHARLKDGHPAASQLVLTGGHPVTHTVTAAADPDHMALGTTPFLRWKVMEDLAAQGHEGNDLTDAELNEVSRFKSQLGGELVTNFVLSGADSLRYSAHRLARRGLRRGRGLVRKGLGRFLGPLGNRP